MDTSPAPWARRAAAGLVLAACAMLVSVGHAMTASNVVPTSRAGAGSSTVSGYNVTSVAYALDATTPTNVNAISFTLSPAAATSVRIRVSGNWYTCTNAAGAATCATTAPQVDVAAVASLEVVAVG